jgi:hypothetical protein
MSSVDQGEDVALGDGRFQKFTAKASLRASMRIARRAQSRFKHKKGV